MRSDTTCVPAGGFTGLTDATSKVDAWATTVKAAIQKPHNAYHCSALRSTDRLLTRAAQKHTIAVQVPSRDREGVLNSPHGAHGIICSRMSASGHVRWWVPAVAVLVGAM